MLRRLGLAPTLQLYQYRHTSLVCSRLSSFTAENTDGPTEEEQITARQWFASFSPSTIPRSLYKITYSTSSGPGGQNVNKVNSKATVRLPLDKLLPLVPSILHQYLRSSRWYAEKSDTLVIQADRSRKQTENVKDCINKLHDLIQSAGKSVVRAETSPEKIAKWKREEKAEKETRLRSKKAQSSKKNSRRGGRGSSY